MLTKLLILAILLLSGCAGWSEWNKEVWHMVQEQYPECQGKEQPPVLIVGDGNGFFLSNVQRVVILDRLATLETLIHEYRHSCGDLQGETPWGLREYYETQW